MNISILSIFLSLSFFSLPALANSYFICGKTVNYEDATVTGYALELSSEDDNYQGFVTGTWNMKVEENADWLEASQDITAHSSEDEDGTITVSIQLVTDQSASGPVGIEYKLIGIYSDEPILDKYSMGGFAGNIKVSSYKCVGLVD